MFPNTPGQGGPPPQVGPLQNPALVGLRMEAAPVSSSSGEDWKLIYLCAVFDVHNSISQFIGFSPQDVPQQSGSVPHHPHLAQSHQMVGGVMPHQGTGMFFRLDLYKLQKDCCGHA